MRDIKFRGKRIDNGKWVYGFVCQAIPETYETYIVPQEIYNFSEIKDGEKFELVSATYYEVDPETVGQYTGLKDKNGVEIWEGDEVFADGFRNGKFVIGFNDGAFCGKQKDSFPIDIIHFYPSIGCTIEVIGNIHDKEGE